MSTSATRRIVPILCLLGIVLALPSFRALAQSGTQGKIVVTVEDSSGAVVPGAALTLVEHQTNDSYAAKTNTSGGYTFVDLPIGTYTLTISRSGYASKVYSDVVVQAAQTTDITAEISVGATTQTVQVSSQTSPVLETTTNAIGSVIDMKQIQDLPVNGRDVTALAFIVPGYSGQNGNGTYNGLPLADSGSSFDGMVGNSQRMKFNSNIEPAVSPRLEDIEQMSVQTDQLDLNSGFGQATTQVNFISKRGTNQFHGTAYEDFRNSGLNANTWYNDALGLRKNKLILNDFGGSVGGPILRDKLFFFGTYAMSKQPGSFTATNDVFTSAAQAGNFTYGNTTVNLLTIAQNNGLPYTVNAEVAKEFAAINSAVGSGKIAGTSDPNFNQVGFLVPSPVTNYFPVGRIDYNASQKARMYLSFTYNQQNEPGTTAPTFPGSGFSNQQAGNQTKNFISSYGFDYVISPQLINQFKAGFVYDVTLFAYNAAPLYATEPTVNWNYPGGTGNMSGQTYQAPINTYYPIFDFSDSMTLQRGKHTIQYGVSWYKEQDHYWNAPGGFYNYNFGLANGDPALNAFTNSGPTATLPGATTAQLQKAQALYAILTGRLSGVNGENSYNIKTKQYAQTGTLSEYPLDEVASAWSLFSEDSWRITKSLTLNYGMRWDINGAERDLTGFYHSANQDSIYGPTAVGDLFDPGSLKGNLNPTLSVHTEPFAPWRVTPQPAFGFAWNPSVSSGPLKALLGGDKTVIRGGYALRRFTQPYQYFWDAATDFGQFYYQQFQIIPNNSGQAGTYAPGSLSIGDPLPTFSLSPPTYEASAPESQFTFVAPTPTYGIEPSLKQPYSESWNLGIQRGLGHSLALEIRYNGNRTLHQWIMVDPNEVNVFENGFLKDFQNAQANLAASGGANFSSSNGHPTPILDAAFGGPSAADYTNGQFITYLNTGQVGSLANVIQSNQGTVQYFCNLVGSGFGPCLNNQGYTGAGAGYPINMFVANPYAAYTGYYYGPENGTGQLTSAGYSNYNGLQVDLRQGSWHGLQYDTNYTFSHSLGLESGNSWTGAYNAFTLRNLRRSYGPTMFDIRHGLHANGTYDIPVGKGRQYLSHNRAVDAVLGGYTLGTIVTWQAGAPAMLGGQYDTFNDFADGGVQLNGVTAKQLQSSIGVRQVPGQAYANFLNPNYLVSPAGGGANATYIAPNTTPGTFGQLVYLHGPHQFFQDMEVTKRIPIHEALAFNLQASFINLWNHPVFGNADGYGSNIGGFPSNFDSGVQDFNFGEGAPTNEGGGFGRTVELRGNFVF
jgi:hypothetical protein